MRPRVYLLAVVILCTGISSGWAAKLDSYRVDLAATSRYSFQPPNKAVEALNQFSYGGRVELEASHRIDSVKANLSLFGHWDQQDEQRRYGDILRANLYWQNENTQIGAGVDSFFWGVSESINIVNVLNQSDMMESLDGKVKLGQSFISLRQSVDNGDLTFYST